MGHRSGYGQRTRRLYRASGWARNRKAPDTTTRIGVWPAALPGIVLSRYAHRTSSPDGARGYVSQGRRQARLHCDRLEQCGRTFGTLLGGNHSMNEEPQKAERSPTYEAIQRAPMVFEEHLDVVLRANNSESYSQLLRDLEPAAVLQIRGDPSCRFSLIRTIFFKKYNFARSRACFVDAKMMGFSRRRRLMQEESRDY